MSLERFENDKLNQGKIEVKVQVGENFTPRFFACHSLPDASYKHSPPPLPEWEWSPQHYVEIMDKVQSLKTIAAPFSELQRQYNSITAEGRKASFENEIEQLWGGDITTLMKSHELTEKDMEISEKIVEHQKQEYKNRARAEDGEWLDPNTLDSPNKFWETQRELAAWGEAGKILLAQTERKIWMEVYGQLASLHDKAMLTQGDALAPEDFLNSSIHTRPGRKRLTENEIEARLKLLELAEKLRPNHEDYESTLLAAYEQLENKYNIWEAIPAWSTVKGWRKYRKHSDE